MSYVFNNSLLTVTSYIKSTLKICLSCPVLGYLKIVSTSLESVAGPIQVFNNQQRDGYLCPIGSLVDFDKK